MKIHVFSREEIETSIRIKSAYVVISIRNPGEPHAKVKKQSGLRVSELASLTAGSFSLGESPSVAIGPAYAKNRRQDNLPLRADMAGRLLEFLVGKMPTAKAFPKLNSEHSADMLKADLESSGLPYDLEGKTFDFHALRHQFISSLAAAGVHPKTAQQSARHSTITLTMDRYSHVFRGDLNQAIELLPDYSARTKQQRATGTSDASPDKGENVLAFCLAHQDGKQGHPGILGEQTTASAQSEEKPHEQQET